MQRDGLMSGVEAKVGLRGHLHRVTVSGGNAD